LKKSLDNAKQQVRNLKKPSKDPAKMQKQKDDFDVSALKIHTFQVKDTGNNVHEILSK
jgi:hypothetical protein